MPQDPVKVAPGIYKPLFENDRVRVLSVRMKPGDKSPMHWHPDNVIYLFSSAKGKFTLPNGKSQVVEFKAGEASWGEAGEHAVENPGTTEVQALLVELKKR